jgi:hypothetical protein
MRYSKQAMAAMTIQLRVSSHLFAFKIYKNIEMKRSFELRLKLLNYTAAGTLQSEAGNYFTRFQKTKGE